ncbi:MAG: DUF308 domain-containing protein [Saprospiraceae bacterium]|nr:DUF308 domain-containing protein [Saprospiraceae bacterium]
MTSLLHQISNSVKHWYLPLIIGVLFILFGIYIFTVPLETYLTLSIFFSASYIVSGLMDIFFSIGNNKTLKGWGWYLVGGIFTLAIGIYLAIYPSISMVVLPFFVGFTMLFRSFQLLGFSFDMKDLKILNWGNAAITSVLGIILSLLLLANPIFTGISLVTITALSFIFVGIASVVLAFNLKKLKDFPDKLTPELKSRINAIQDEIINQVKG